ncbi:copper amine oxidase N-terminal domain-containing protein [Paenibacillus aestuarii]|uniref:Copper amine oxidase N-terminal domain-containing protein n=1 Tax=Paenibacillus aestuarii TaxID=516965 RepID=A0ABW0KCI2_9BACL|nr:copper amine oxidase N-terminal domain-containing protein [Paenibacillus aestuarii]
MPKKRLSWWLSTALVVLLFALTGCQAVQGLDIAQAIQNNASITSGASNTSIQFELVPGTKPLSADEQALVDTFNPLKLEITHAIMEDKQHLSADGTLTYSKGSIPFKLNLLDTQYVIQIEGAPKPVVFDPFAAQGGTSAQAAALLPEGIQSKLGSAIQQIQPALVKLLIAKMPNPQHITVTSVSDTINQEPLSLQKAHIEMNGTEAASLLSTMLSGLLEDEEGLQDLIGQLYDAILPVIQQQAGADSQSSVFLSLLQNKQVAVGFAYSAVRSFLEKAVADLGQASQDSSSSWFSSKATLSLDLFIDGNKQLRKQAAELYIPAPEPDADIAAYKLSFAAESWDLNKPMKLNPIDTSGGTMKITSEPSSLFVFLSQLDKQSAIYKLLKDDLHVTRKVIHLAMNQSGDAEEGSLQPFINADGVTMVPVRFISEQLGAEVKWNGDLQQVTIIDALTGKTIVLTLDNKIASVNGANIQLESAATLHDSSTFVPVRFIAETLGSKVEFDDATRVVTIKRD